MTESLDDIYARIEDGEIPNDELRKAYRNNLQRVMAAAKPLIDATSRRTVITSDHGELLGEDGRYLHGGLPHRILSDLPWLEVDSVVGTTEKLDVEISGKDGGEESIEDQLQALGYL